MGPFLAIMINGSNARLKLSRSGDANVHITLGHLGSADGLPPVQCQAITDTAKNILSTGTLGKNLGNFNQNTVISIMKTHLKMSSTKW